MLKEVLLSTGEQKPARGVFWLIDEELLAFPFVEGSTIGVSKSGRTYNHQKLWEYVKPVGCRWPYNHYPRGRVEFTGNGRPVIYMNPHISQDRVPEIKLAFHLTEEPIIRYDGSAHYKCCFD